MAQLSFLKYLNGIYKLNLHASNIVHNAIIQAIYDCFVMVSGDVNIMRLELCLNSASGVWLDYWGSFFSVYRKSEESDFDYHKRIIASVIQPKSTVPAVKANIVTHLNTLHKTNYTSEDIKITEPFLQVAKYSHKGTLSNSTRFYSKDYYTHAVMDISIPEDVSQELIDLVNSVKAAGVKVIWSILNSYDILKGFNNANEAWAYYHRHIQSRTERKQHGGLILSNSSPHPKLSGAREIWSLIDCKYMWYAVVQKRNTDESVTLTKKDLVGLLDYYTEVEEIINKDVSDNFKVSEGRLNANTLLSGSEAVMEYKEKLIKISEEMLESLELMSQFLTLDVTQRLSTSEGVLFKYTTGHEVFGKIMKTLEEWKKHNKEYYENIQSPIENGERVNWYIERNENWIWNTPTMTHDDFFELWEPMKGYSEHTVDSIIEFEDAYEKGYITFADKYQPPLVRTRERFLYQITESKPWIWNSPVLLNGSLEQIFQRQFDVTDNGDRPDPTLSDLCELESFMTEGFLVNRDHQGFIEVKTS